MTTVELLLYYTPIASTMNMHILSDLQFIALQQNLDAVAKILAESQAIQLDTDRRVQTVAMPKGEVLQRKAVSQDKSHASRRKGKRGVQSLNAAKALEIKQLLAEGGISIAKIAARFGVHPTTVNCIKSGKTWKHVQLVQPAQAQVAA